MKRVKEFGGSLDFNVTTFMENGTGAFHNHEHSMLIWAIALSQHACSLTFMLLALSQQPPHYKSLMPLLVSFNFPAMVFYSLPFAHRFWWNRSQDNIKHSTNWRRGKHLVLGNFDEILCPTEEDILIKYMLRKKCFASSELRCCTLTNKNL